MSEPRMWPGGRALPRFWPNPLVDITKEEEHQVSKVGNTVWPSVWVRKPRECSSKASQGNWQD